MLTLDAASVTAFAAVTASVLVAGLILFQFALALGVPWGRAAYGGRSALLPTRLRITSAVAGVVWGLVALVLLGYAGFDVWTPLPPAAFAAVTWTVAGLLVLAVVLHAVTPSRIERLVWLPVTVVLLAAVVTVGAAAPA